MEMITSLFILLLLLTVYVIEPVNSQKHHYDPLGRDLATFVTRPELRPPLFNITTYIPDRVSPGYWFYSPYDTLLGEPSRRTYSPAQTGPSIFDSDGNLIWSGALEFGMEGSVTDFKIAKYNGESYLSFIMDPRVTQESMFGGEGIILDPSYSVVKRLPLSIGDGGFNMHEFKVINDGRTALAESGNRKLVDFSKVGLGQESGYIMDGIFVEMDLVTGKEVFRWQSSDHVPSNESYTARSPFDKAWDYFHMNSVDKNADGDYLISARFTSCIYKISGKDGSIIWRLGGVESDFDLIGFNFSSQHHARFREETSTTTVISFLNNASDMGRSNNSTANWSSAYLVTLDTITMTAVLTRSWDRPDHQLTRLRGGVQFLPNNNVFVSWGDDGYVSEFGIDGELIQEARFATKRFVVYRTFKFNFSGTPSEPPALKAMVYGASNSTITTVIYVSWNGATEVRSWRFYGTADSSSSRQSSPSSLLGTAIKQGFETLLVVAGHVKWVFAEAVGANGQVLGRSALQEASVMFSWSGANEIDSVASSWQALPLPLPTTHTHADDSFSIDQGIDIVPTATTYPILSSNSDGCVVVYRQRTGFSVWVIIPVAVLSSLVLACLLKAHSIAQEKKWWIANWKKKTPFRSVLYTDD